MAGLVKNFQCPRHTKTNTANKSQRNSKRIKKSELSNECSCYLMNNKVNCDVKQCKKERVSDNSLKKDSSLRNFLVPLLQGWRREVVFRATSVPSRRDIYYHPPVGKKLRSIREVGIYLKSNGVKDLTVENFSFCCSLLGLGEPYETSRNAAELSIFLEKRNLLDKKPCRSRKKKTIKSSSTENVKSSKLQLKYRCSDTSEQEHTVIESGDGNAVSSGVGCCHKCMKRRWPHSGEE